MKNIEMRYEPELVGWSKFLPSDVLTNPDLVKSGLDTSDEWIRERTGIRERRISKKYTVAQMAVFAARAALHKAQIKESEVDRIIVASVTHRLRFPSAACLVQAELGCHASALDIGAGCSGFLYGMDMGIKDIESGRNKIVVVIGAETLSRITDYSDRETCILFGDGAGAFVLRAADARLITRPQVYLGADGRDPSLLWASSDGHDLEGKKQPPNKANTIHMEGRKVFKGAVNHMTESADVVIRMAGISEEEIDATVIHHANDRITQAYAENRKKKGSRHSPYTNIDRYGNTSSASIPIAFTEAVEEGCIRSGDNVVLAAAGAGLTWGGIYFRFGERLIKQQSMPPPSVWNQIKDSTLNAMDSFRRRFWTSYPQAALLEIPATTTPEDTPLLQS